MRIFTLLLLFLAACVSPNGIEVNDNRVFMPTVRLVGDSFGNRTIDPWNQPRKEFEDFEMGATYAGGSDSGNSYDLFESWIGGRYGYEYRKWGVYMIGAGAFNHFRIKGGGQSASSDDFGLLGGGQFDYRFNKTFSWYVRGTYTWLPFNGDAASTQAETGIGVTVTKDLDVLFGWRYWRYQEEDLIGLPAQDVELETNGFVLGLLYRF